jgi:periodic tryptophan protein 1
VFSASWSPDDPLTVAAGGSTGKLQIWDVTSNAGARKTLSGKLAAAGRELKEKSGSGLVGLLSDDEDESDVED